MESCHAEMSWRDVMERCHGEMSWRDVMVSCGGPASEERAAANALVRDVGNEELGKLSRAGEGNQVSAWDFIGALSQPFARHAGLKIAWEEPIIFANHDMDWDIGPRLEGRAFVERDIALATCMRGSFFSDIFWHVVEEVGGELELDAVATALGGRNARLLPSGTVPPLAGRFAGKRDHCIHEDEQANRRPRAGADERGRERTHRLGNEYHVVSLPDRADNAIGIGGEARVRVITGKIDGKGLMTCLLEQGKDAMPIPCGTAGAGNENEGCHEPSLQAKSARTPYGLAHASGAAAIGNST